MSSKQAIQPHILVVDDEPDIRELLEITLLRMGLKVTTAENISAARDALKHHRFSLCLTDMNMPDGNGIELVQWIGTHAPQTPVAVITAYGSIEAAISALKAGAFDFVSKPVDLTRLRDLIQVALKLSQEPAQKPGSQTQGPVLLGQSVEIERLQGQIHKLARSQAPIYISGESGSGKELVARLIHARGPRASQPFVPVNCGAIPNELIESELFGHKKGSFTGATDHKEGLFRAAQGGTLFLDEIADLPLNMQVKLLRAIQEKAVRPVGEQQEIPIDVRILSATHKPLADLVAAGEFRQDLFYRINVIELKVPPLRARAGDIPLLCNHILSQLALEYESPAARLSDEALEKLRQYDFPGNVRELENLLERAFTLCDSDVIQAADLLLEPPSPATTPDTAETGHAAAMPDIDAPVGAVNLEHYLENIERQTIEKALEATRWNKTAAAKRLGISFRALRYRLKKLGME